MNPLEQVIVFVNTILGSMLVPLRLASCTLLPSSRDVAGA